MQSHTNNNNNSDLFLITDSKTLKELIITFSTTAIGGKEEKLDSGIILVDREETRWERLYSIAHLSELTALEKKAAGSLFTKGDLQAQVDVAFYYYFVARREYNEKNYEKYINKSIKYFKKAATLGDVESIAMLGLCHYKGLAHGLDDFELSKSARTGNVLAKLFFADSELNKLRSQCDDEIMSNLLGFRLLNKNLDIVRIYIDILNSKDIAANHHYIHRNFIIGRACAALAEISLFGYGVLSRDIGRAIGFAANAQHYGYFDYDEYSYLFCFDERSFTNSPLYIDLTNIHTVMKKLMTEDIELSDCNKQLEKIYQMMVDDDVYSQGIFYLKAWEILSKAALQNPLTKDKDVSVWREDIGMVMTKGATLWSNVLHGLPFKRSNPNDISIPMDGNTAYRCLLKATKKSKQKADAYYQMSRVYQFGLLGKKIDLELADHNFKKAKKYNHPLTNKPLIKVSDVAITVSEDEKSIISKAVATSEKTQTIPEQHNKPNDQPQNLSLSITNLSDPIPDEVNSQDPNINLPEIIKTEKDKGLIAKYELALYFFDTKNDKAYAFFFAMNAEKDFSQTKNGNVSYYLGMCYLNGIGVQINKTKAIDLFKSASSCGCELATTALNNPELDIKNFEFKALINFDAKAQAELGHYYFTKQNPDAVTFLKLAYVQKYTDIIQSPTENFSVEYDLAVCHEKGTLGVSQDLDYAAYLYDCAANKGFSPAKDALLRPIFKIPLLKVRAENGDREALAELGHHYLSTNDEKAGPMLLKAASMSNEPAVHIDLACCYEQGLGLKQSYHNAAFQYQQAVKFGDKKSSITASNLYRTMVFPNLGTDTTLQALDLRFTNIADDDMLDLQKILMTNATIEKLDLQYTHVSNVCIENLSKNLKRPVGLTILHGDCKKTIVFPDASFLNKPISLLPSSNNLLLNDEKLNGTDDDLITYSDIELGEKIGSGSFGDVFKAKYIHSIVAVKFIKNHSNNDQSEFKKEITVMKKLKSEYLVHFYGYSPSPQPCLVMEYMSNGSLYHLLRSENKVKLQNDYIQIALDIAYGLAFLHSKKIVHRDIKSLNILINGSFRAKISDYGLSHIKSDTMTSSIKDASGSLRWMAPELLGRRAVANSTASDIYSYGRTLLELISGNIPFENTKNDTEVVTCILQAKDDPLPENGKYSKKFSSLISLCLFRDPNKRPNINQVIEHLKSCTDEDSTLKSGYIDNINSASVKLS